MLDLATAGVLVTIVLRLASGTEAAVPQNQQPSVSRTLTTSELQLFHVPTPAPCLRACLELYYTAEGLKD